MKVHTQYLFSFKMLYMMLGIQTLFLLSCLYFSRFYLSKEELIFDAMYYQSEYMFEAVNILKILVIMFCLLVTINAFVIHKYDYFLIVRIDRKKVMISKILVLMGMVLLFVFMNYLMLLVIPLYLTPYFSLSHSNVLLFAKLCLLGVLYLSIFMVVYLLFKHLLPLFIILTGYMISFLGNELSPLKEDSNGYQRVISLIFPDIIEYQSIGYDFLYGSVIILALTLIYMLVSVLVYNSTDI